MAEQCIRRHDLVIIGGGATGLTAGIYAARARMDAVMLEAMLAGGQLNNADVIENYPGFPDGIMATDLVGLMERQARRFGLEIERAKVEIMQRREGDFLLQTTAGDFCAKAAIVCTGGRHKHLGVPGEREFAGKGVSYCATCDGPLFRDKELMVVGGGNSAIDEALFLARFAKKVYVVHRRDELRAEKILQERAMAHAKIEFLWSSVVTGIGGSEFVEKAEVKDLKTEETRAVEVGAVFIAIGMQAATDFVPEEVERDEGGFIVTDSAMRTSVPGIFAAGDIVAGSPRQITTGVGQATSAVIAAQQYLDALEQ